MWHEYITKFDIETIWKNKCDYIKKIYQRGETKIISEKQVKKYCNEGTSLIENYLDSMNDETTNMVED